MRNRLEDINELNNRYMFEKEYETLRFELNDNKKYVFERPLLIITAALVAFEYVSKTTFVLLLPDIIIYLLLFNLKFTSNRLNSNARIVSYLRLAIEARDPANYSWETFLSEYRVDTHKKGLKFYPTIYYFHILTIIIFMLIETALYFDNQIDLYFTDLKKEIITISSIVFCVVELFFLIKLGSELSPKKLAEFFNNEIIDVEKTLVRMNKTSITQPKLK